MNLDIYLMPLAASFVLSAILLVFFILLSRKKIGKDLRTGDRHVHKEGTSRLGGAAIILTFILVAFLDRRLVIETPLLSVLVISGLILLFGLLDDFRQLNWKIQLAFQILLAVSVFAVGIRLQYITNPFGGIFLFSGQLGIWLSFILATCWMVFLMNAMNWVDGIDGASGGIALIGVATIFFLSLRPEVNQPPIGIVAAILGGSLAAFLILNFHPAKIMAGSSGSMFMGFILAILAIFSGAKMATTLLVLAIPTIDALWVILERMRAKASIFSADRRHLHYRLLELGWSQNAICGLYWVITALIAAVALNTDAKGKLWTLGLITVGVVCGLYVIKNKVERKNA